MPVTSPSSGPILPRRQLAAELRRLRAEAGLHLDQVSKKLMISTSKLSRLENAQGRPQGRDVHDLILLYDIDNTPLAEMMMRWTRAAREEGWWTEYEYETSGSALGIDTHVAYESEAAVARIYTIPFVPALLQTEEYTRELTARWSHGETLTMSNSWFSSGFDGSGSSLAATDLGRCTWSP